MNDRVAELFHQLADLSPEERARYCTQHRVDEQTRKEAEALLAFDAHDSRPLLRDIGLAAGEALSRVDENGSRCGPFRLVSVIGRGGMGVVYLAERVDGEVTQRAAVKLLQHGLHDTQRERFLQERQILAAITHPNIARLLDAGHLEDGQPFLAMEYVEGKPIDIYAAGLGVRPAIRLFLKVCAAVGYLHRHLIVHRDLKPGNIVVTAEGEPKLLDFGIAKILDEVTDSTVTSMRMLTPDYASPEQVTGGAISTSTDIYSLGAVLYRLLTGRASRQFEDGSQAGMAYLIATQEVTRPSKWAPALKGDLELILMKALRKEPQERYETVEQFAEDLEAFLESRPIRARKGDLMYRAGKLARRYWLPVMAAALALVGLLVGLFLVNRERAIAQRRFSEVRQLSNKLFDIDRQVRTLPGSSKARQLIVDTSLEYLRRLVTDARADPDLTLDVGTAYMRVGRVQGVPISPNLGQADEAEKNLRIAEALIRSVREARPANRTALLRSAQIAHDRMILAEARRPDTEALPLARQSQEWLDKYLSAGPVEEAEKDQVVIVGMNVANWYARKDLTGAALSLLSRTIAIARATDQPRQAGAALIVVSQTLRRTGDLDGALAAIREGVGLLEPPPGIQSPGLLLSLALALSTQGDILGAERVGSLGRPHEASAYFERSFRLAADLARQDASDAFSRFSLAADGARWAGALHHTDPRQAVAIYEETLRALAEIKNNSKARRNEISALAGSTYPLRRLGRRAEAGKRLAAAFSRLRELKLYPAEAITPRSEADEALRAWAEQEAGTGNVRRGIEIYQELLGKIMVSGPKPETHLDNAVYVSSLYAAIAVLHRQAGQAGDASVFEARRLELWRHWDRQLPNNPFVLGQIAALAAK